MVCFYQNMLKTTQNCTLFDSLDPPDSPGGPRDATCAVVLMIVLVWALQNIDVLMYCLCSLIINVQWQTVVLS